MSQHRLSVVYEYEPIPDSEERLARVFDILFNEILRLNSVLTSIDN